MVHDLWYARNKMYPPENNPQVKMFRHISKLTRSRLIPSVRAIQSASTLHVNDAQPSKGVLDYYASTKANFYESTFTALKQNAAWLGNLGRPANVLVFSCFSAADAESISELLPAGSTVHLTDIPSSEAHLQYALNRLTDQFPRIRFTAHLLPTDVGISALPIKHPVDICVAWHCLHLLTHKQRLLLARDLPEA